MSEDKCVLLYYFNTTVGQELIYSFKYSKEESYGTWQEKTETADKFEQWTWA